MKVKPLYIADLNVPAEKLRTFEVRFNDESEADILAPYAFDALEYAWDNLGQPTHIVEV